MLGLGFEGDIGYIGVTKGYIGFRDLLYFLGYGMPYIHEKGSFFLAELFIMWAKEPGATF